MTASSLSTQAGWCHEQLDIDVIESNSNLGKAMQYLIRHLTGDVVMVELSG